MKTFIFCPDDGASITGHGPGNALVCKPGGLALLADDRAAMVRKAYGADCLTEVTSTQLSQMAKAQGCGVTREGPNGDQARALWLIKRGGLLEPARAAPATAEDAPGREDASSREGARAMAMTMTIKDLRAIGAKHSVDLTGKIRKADIVDALMEAGV